MRSGVKSNEAVSPVVGVMLMLVVTIIIAAVVSAFAGGMGSSQKSTPQVTISGKFSQSNGLTISHMGGEAIPLSSVNFMTTPSEVMGPDAGKFAWVINKSIILDPANSNYQIWNSTTGVYNTTSFKPGDTFVVTHDNCVDYLPNSSAGGPIPGVNQNAQMFWTSDTYGKGLYFGAYQFGNPKNIGKYFYLDLVDSTGKLISRAKVTITG